MAAEIEKLRIDPRTILDLTVSQEMGESGPSWSATLYWSDPEDQE